MKSGAIAIIATLATQASAHMGMVWPPTFRGKENPNVGQNIDYSWTSPLAADGSNYPCKGELSLLGTEQGKPVTSYSPGQSYNITISGGAHHGGGSCQISLSHDQGKTFKVIKSIEGGCPVAGTSNLDFTIPSDAPTGDAVLAWTWFNRIGNREAYMGCSSVSLVGGVQRRAKTQNGGTSVQKRQTSFDSRPDIFLANLGNGCTVPEGIDVKFPNPGPDVEKNSDSLGEPEGSCGAAVPGGSGEDDSGSGPSNPDGDASAPEAPAPTLPGGVFITTPIGGSPTAQPEQPETPADTTFATVTKPAPAEPTEPAPADPVPAPSTSPAPEPSSGSGSEGSGPVAGAQSGPCTNEGAWNCVGGTQFQRCASGRWSDMIPMAEGTSCQPGVSNTLTMSKRLRFRRS